MYAKKNWRLKRGGGCSLELRRCIFWQISETPTRLGALVGWGRRRTKDQKNFIVNRKMCGRCRSKYALWCHDCTNMTQTFQISACTGI